jgi:hypothetical protein
MKKLVSTLCFITALSLTSAYAEKLDITLSNSIDLDMRTKIDKDLKNLDSMIFYKTVEPRTLKVMGLLSLSSHTLSRWLGQRVNYIISDESDSTADLLTMKNIFISQNGVDFPNSEILPYSLDVSSRFHKNLAETSNSNNGSQASMIVMSNLGTALYMDGKDSNTIYGMNIVSSKTLENKKVIIKSPRAGIIQIGEGLFSPDLTINESNADAISNSILRLSVFFHEARHSDGNGKSLGFYHANCPKTHDYADQPACDENLNGPYAVGTLVLKEMVKNCSLHCNEAEKETLKTIIVDFYSRIIDKTHKGEKSTDWDATPETI